MEQEITKYLEKNHCRELYFTEEGCKLINHVQEMIIRERLVIQDEHKFLIPGCDLNLVSDERIGAFVARISGEYCIFVNKGIIEEQKAYLEKLNWEFIRDEKDRTEYIDRIIEYGFYFSVFHEYAHVVCGHVDKGLKEFADVRAQEYEADIFSMDYLIKYILYSYPDKHHLEELEKAFLAVYFLIVRMQKQDYREYYNDKNMENYYSDDKIAMRDHPLSAQRILYLYEMLNILIVTDKFEMLPIKETVFERLKIIKRLSDAELPNKDVDYRIADDSIQQLKQSVQDIRKKIPRLGNNIMPTN